MTREELLIKTAKFAWQTQTERAGALINSLTHEQFLIEIAPGRNTVRYIIGHLIAIHDAMNGILGIGNRAYAFLDEAFVKNPDKSAFDMPDADTLKKYWNDVHEGLETSLRNLSIEDWFSRHNAVTDEVFIRNPSRNKLSVLLNRTNHAAYHLGQLKLLK